jgi:hypothetical protein
MKFHDDVDGLTENLKAADSEEKRNRLWEQLLPKLKNVARNRIGAAGKTGQESATELVHEVYPGLQRAIDNPETTFESRAHFLAYAARAMQRQLAAQAKRRMTEELLADDFAVESASPALTIALNEALDVLAERFPRAVRAYQLREYAGYGHDEILELMSSEYRTKALLASDLTVIRKALVELLKPKE